MRIVRLHWQRDLVQTGTYSERWQLVETVRGKRVERADVWVYRDETVWHTYDRKGSGGENSATWGHDAKYEAMACALAAVVRWESEHGGAVHLKPPARKATA